MRPSYEHSESLPTAAELPNRGQALPVAGARSHPPPLAVPPRRKPAACVSRFVAAVGALEVVVIDHPPTPPGLGREAGTRIAGAGRRHIPIVIFALREGALRLGRGASCSSWKPGSTPTHRTSQRRGSMRRKVLLGCIHAERVSPWGTGFRALRCGRSEWSGDDVDLAVGHTSLGCLRRGRPAQRWSSRCRGHRWALPDGRRRDDNSLRPLVLSAVRRGDVHRHLA